MPTEHHLSISRTARYYTHGNLSAATQQIWFVCHGYGQLAESFIRHFEILDANTHYVVAPEALSRFYWNGFSNKAVASWMTSEDRLNEIEDYVNYLDALYESILAKKSKENISINILGFSQGATTVSRWMGLGKIKKEVSKLIFWAGAIAHDLDWKKAIVPYSKCNILLVYGDDDQFVKTSHIEKQKAMLQQKALDCTIIHFQGTHTIHQESLLKLAE